LRGGSQTDNDARGEHDVTIGKIETAGEFSRRVHQGGQDVVALPFRVVHEARGKTARLDAVAPIAAHDRDVVDAGGGEGAKLPM
jgi:hypothetical protein